MRVLSPVRSTVFCVCVAALLPVSVGAQTGQITGQIDGTAIDLTLGTPDADEPGFFINRYAGGGFTELDVDLLAISEGAAGYEGVMIGLSFDADGDMALSDFTPDMLFDAEVMLIEDWPSDQIDPTAVWLANLDSADTLDIALSLTGDTQTISGQFASSEFCLLEFDDMDTTPALRGGDMLCKSAALTFTASSAGAPSPAPAGGPVEVEVLGRIEGMVGDDAFDWLTILRSGGQGTATWAQAEDGTTHLSLQGHSPASANFLYEDVLSINIWTQAPIPEGTPIRAEVMFTVEGSGGMPRVFYTSDDGAGEATALIRNVALNDAPQDIALEVSGTLCRVEGFTPVDGDCRTFQAIARTELIDDGAPF